MMTRTQATGLLVCCCSLMCSPAFAGSYHNTATVYGAAEQHDDPFDGRVFWIEAERPDGSPIRATGVRINEQFGLTVGHIFGLGGETFTNHVVGNGSNFITDRGETRSIAEFGMHPTWDGTYAGGFLDQVDLAWFRFDSPWTGPDAMLGALDIGDVATVPEFGQPATGGGGWLPVDGERRAFDAPIVSYGATGLASSDYLVSRYFPPVLGGLPLEGMGTPGSSGSPWFNDFGDLVGITAAGIGEPLYGGQTAAVDLSLFEPWITANTMIPEPASISFLVVGAMAMMRRRVVRRAG